MPTDTAALARAAFERIAAREYDAARPITDRALSLEPRNGMLAHAMAHLATDSGAFAAGAAYLRTFLVQDDPSHGMHAHSSWHLAVLRRT